MAQHTMITEIEVALPAPPAQAYTLFLGAGLLARVSDSIPKNTSTVVLITDSHVKKHYADSLEQVLSEKGYRTLLLAFPAGEKSKQIRTKCKLEEQMIAYGCDRQTLIIAIGGGVVGDLAGFIAATYMRGIPFIQVPTSLLAMVDSSIGGKTGIDTPAGKNLIGAFWQPLAVISDIHVLRTLSKKQMLNGLFEAIKMCLTCDAEAFYEVKTQLPLLLKYDETCLIRLIERAVKIKANIVACDEKDHHIRAILNFGHTIGHALERLTHYELLHGYAVAYGMLIEAKLSQLMGLLEPEDAFEIQDLFSQLNICGSFLKNYSVNDLIACTQSDKKKQSDGVRYVLLSRIGACYQVENQMTHVVADELLRQAWTEVLKEDRT